MDRGRTQFLLTINHVQEGVGCSYIKIFFCFKKNGSLKMYSLSETLQAWEIAERVKSLLYKSEELSSTPPTPKQKLDMAEHIFNASTGEAEKGGAWTSQPSQPMSSHHTQN